MTYGNLSGLWLPVGKLSDFLISMLGWKMVGWRTLKFAAPRTLFRACVLAPPCRVVQSGPSWMNLAGIGALLELVADAMRKWILSRIVCGDVLTISQCLSGWHPKWGLNVLTLRRYLLACADVGLSHVPFPGG